MKTIISSKGQIVLPIAIRQQDGIEPGQEFEVQPIDHGEYLLKRTKRRRNEGLVHLLLSCPAKGWFQPADRVNDRRHFCAKSRMTYLVDANVLSEPTKRRPDAKVVAWLSANERDFVVDSVILGEIALGILVLPRGASVRSSSDGLRQWPTASIVWHGMRPSADAGRNWSRICEKRDKRFRCWTA